MIFNKKELAYCGTYCLQCSFRATNELQDKKNLLIMPDKYYNFKHNDLSECACEGCNGNTIYGQCDIQDCAREKNLECCSDCTLFPCDTIKEFEHDTIEYHKKAVESLYKIKKSGRNVWFEEFKSTL